MTFAIDTSIIHRTPRATPSSEHRAPVDVRSITQALGGRMSGRRGRAPCPVCQAGKRRANTSLSIAEGADGNLLAFCFKGCGFDQILDALRGLGLVEGSSSFRPATEEDRARMRAEDEAEAAKKAAQAEACWKEAGPIEGTVAETYLRGRGITAELPRSLRFHPECWHGPTAKRLPAMVAAVQGVARPAIHRTYLRPDGSGKAEVEPAKMMLGSTRGGAVRLADGRDGLIVAEGLESALSLTWPSHMGAQIAVWAALSTSGMETLTLPRAPGSLLIAVDGEEAGRAAGRRLATRAVGAGWTVQIADPGDGKDYNDVLREGGAL